MAAEGLLAGMAGTLVLAAFERLEWAALGGRVPLYAPAPIGRRLARRWVRSGFCHGRDERLGHALRWVYGPSLGVLFAKARSLLPQNPVAAGALLGAGISAFETVAMPAVDATPPLKAWPKAEIALLFLHTTVFGIATAVALSLLSPARSGEVRRPVAGPEG